MLGFAACSKTGVIIKQSLVWLTCVGLLLEFGILVGTARRVEAAPVVTATLTPTQSDRQNGAEADNSSPSVIAKLPERYGDCLRAKVTEIRDLAKNRLNIYQTGLNDIAERAITKDWWNLTGDFRNNYGALFTSFTEANIYKANDNQNIFTVYARLFGYGSQNDAQTPDEMFAANLSQARQNLINARASCTAIFNGFLAQKQKGYDFEGVQRAFDCYNMLARLLQIPEIDPLCVDMKTKRSTRKSISPLLHTDAYQAREEALSNTEEIALEIIFVIATSGGNAAAEQSAKIGVETSKKLSQLFLKLVKEQAMEAGANCLEAAFENAIARTSQGLRNDGGQPIGEGDAAKEAFIDCVIGAAFGRFMESAPMGMKAALKKILMDEEQFEALCRAYANKYGLSAEEMQRLKGSFIK